MKQLKWKYNPPNLWIAPSSIGTLCIFINEQGKVELDGDLCGGYVEFKSVRRAMRVGNLIHYKSKLLSRNQP